MAANYCFVSPILIEPFPRCDRLFVNRAYVRIEVTVGVNTIVENCNSRIMRCVTCICRFLLTVLQPQFCSDMVRILHIFILRLRIALNGIPLTEPRDVLL